MRTTRVICLFDYEARTSKELSLTKGQKIQLLHRGESGWALGEKDGRMGWFPILFVYLDETDDDEDEYEDDDKFDKYEEERDEIDPKRRSNMKGRFVRLFKREDKIGDGVTSSSPDKDRPIPERLPVIDRLSDTDKQGKLSRFISISGGVGEIIGNFAGRLSSATPSFPGSPLSPKVSSVSCATPMSNNSIFGKPIKDVMDKDLLIPEFVCFACRHIVNNCLSLEGIFRIPTQSSELMSLKTKIDSGDKCPTSVDAHAVPCLLKKYLRELPEPLFTYSLYSKFIDIIDEEDQEKQIDQIKAYLKLLPTENYHLLYFLFAFLKLVSSHSAQNMMNITNLAIVFAPNLIRSAEEDKLIVMPSMKSNKILEIILMNFDLLFEPVDFMVLLKDEEEKRKNLQEKSKEESKMNKSDPNVLYLSGVKTPRVDDMLSVDKSVKENQLRRNRSCPSFKTKITLQPSKYDTPKQTDLAETFSAFDPTGGTGTFTASTFAGISLKASLDALNSSSSTLSSGSKKGNKSSPRKPIPSDNPTTLNSPTQRSKSSSVSEPSSKGSPRHSALHSTPSSATNSEEKKNSGEVRLKRSNTNYSEKKESSDNSSPLPIKKKDIKAATPLVRGKSVSSNLNNPINNNNKEELDKKIKRSNSGNKMTEISKDRSPPRIKRDKDEISSDSSNSGKPLQKEISLKKKTSSKKESNNIHTLDDRKSPRSISSKQNQISVSPRASDMKKNISSSSHLSLPNYTSASCSSGGTSSNHTGVSLLSSSKSGSTSASSASGSCFVGSSPRMNSPSTPRISTTPAPLTLPTISSTCPSPGHSSSSIDSPLSSSSTTPSPSSSSAPSSSSSSFGSGGSCSKGQSSAKPIKSIALHDYDTPSTSHQCPFLKGDTVYILQMHNSGWWYGYLEGKKPAFFPSNFLKVIE